MENLLNEVQSISSLFTRLMSFVCDPTNGKMAKKIIKSSQFHLKLT